MVLGTNPKVLIGAFAWMKLHPSEMQDASEVRSLALSEMFMKKFTAGSKGSTTAPSAELKSKKAKEKEKAKEALRQARQGPASTAFKVYSCVLLSFIATPKQPKIIFLPLSDI